ncbi:MarR family winged helix-turn-helix transcriptional regulator [Pseudomonas sp.]|uniref:MarR family winged helix-turn-helix transcriptional regulator n=1 Tax=Pseudomonas sp. TaxID=306 RepID=UPI00272CB8E0|nr:MarR family transcriptional regulator [Pseudomonas sp.]
MQQTDDRPKSLGSLLRQPYQALQHRLYQALPQHGFADIRAAHSAVLRHIDPEGTRITVLAERAGMTKQSMGYLVDSLVAGGYLNLMPDPADGRAKLAALTQRGTAAIQTLLEESAACERLLAQRIGEEKLAQLRELLEQAGEVLLQEMDS